MTVVVVAVAVAAAAAVVVVVVVVIEIVVPWQHQHRRPRLLRSLAAEDAAAIAEVDGALLLASYWSHSWAAASDPAVTRSEPKAPVEADLLRHSLVDPFRPSCSYLLTFRSERSRVIT